MSFYTVCFFLVVWLVLLRTVQICSSSDSCEMNDSKINVTCMFFLSLILHVQPTFHCKPAFAVLKVSRANFHLYEFQFEILRHVVGLTDPEDVSDDVLRRIAQCPQLLHHFIRLVDVSLHAVSQHAFNHQRVRLITHLEHVFTTDVTKAGVRGL